jgi:hypothetical protein
VTVRSGSQKFCTGIDGEPPGGVNCVYASDAGTSDFTDDDADGKPGISLPSVLAAGSTDEIKLTAYSSLSIILINKNVTLVDANTMNADSSFATYGQVGRFNVGGIAPGPIKVLPLSPSVKIVFKHDPGDLTCDQVIAKFP